MESFSLEEKNIIKDIRNLFRLKKGQNYTLIRGIRNLFRQGKETKAIKDEKEEQNYYKPVRAVTFGVTIILNTRVTVIK